MDESGTPDVPGNTSHFVLAGVAIPISKWAEADRDISEILGKYGLADQELHTAWLLRPYLEQSKIPNFVRLDRAARRAAVERARNAHLLQLQQARKQGAYKQARKNYENTQAYIHLTHDERVRLVREVADCISRWDYARLFAECIDKLYFDPARTRRKIEEQAFEQVVSRFEQFLENAHRDNLGAAHGLLVHDNNETVSRKHTKLMRDFHKQGTLWTDIAHIIETPMFVDSSLTSMVQAADLCAYALRRFVENQETELFERIFKIADRIRNNTVGVRHYSPNSCRCQICVQHG